MMISSLSLRLFENGRIWTGDRAHRWAENMVIAGEHILAIGGQEVREYFRPEAKVTEDLRGKLVVPGFNDGHVHFLEGGFSLLGLDLRQVGSLREFALKVKSHAEKLGAGEWITGGNWNHENWGGNPLPDRGMLDDVTDGHPALLHRIDGHLAVANSLALKLAGIGERTPDPEGGEIVRRSDGAPTGILKDNAIRMVEKVIPEPGENELERALEAALVHAAQLGVTSIQDNVSFSALRVYQRFRQMNKSTARVYAWIRAEESQNLIDLGLVANFGDPWLRLGAVKVFSDGSLGAGTAYFFEPYEDNAEGSRGLLVHEPNTLRQLMQSVHEAGLQIAVHAIGDAANALVLDILTELPGLRKRRHRIEHAQSVRDEDLRRYAENRIVASVQPVHAIDDLQWAYRKIGDRTRISYRIRSFLEWGIPVAFGTDWPVEPLNPLLGIYAAVTRKPVKGQVEKDLGGSECVSVQEAIACYTAGSAYAEFQDECKGTLSPGKLADFVVLSEDIFDLDPQAIPNTGAEMTVVGGKVVWRRQ